MKRISLSLTLLAALSLLPADAAPQLKIGDPAPPLKAARWLKGRPVTALESNQVYVVEFWATWCVPCRKNIPHLTALAKQYEGKARILGFSIWETEKTDHAQRLAKVGKFVEEMGDSMNYGVAADDNEGSMAKLWMEAAEENGIPTAFIVGRDGRIAWIGNPAAGMDRVLADVVAGTVDTKAIEAAAAARQQQRDTRAQQREWLKPVSQLQEAKQYPEALAALAEVERAHPELDGKLGYLRYTLLLAHDEPAAYREARRLLTGELKDNAGSLYRIARDLTDPPGRKTKDWDLAYDVAHRACELSRFTNPSMLSTLAEAYAGKGDYAKAIETEEQALTLGRKDPGFAQSVKYLERRLQSFKAAQQKPGQ
jgi:thiol-disulfide isomerase/thioredoxin